jgi:alpha-galactosidase
MLKDMETIDAAHRNEIKVNVLGINHFTWFDKAAYKHIDLMPIYREFAGKYYDDGFNIPGEEKRLNKVFISSNRIKFDLFRKYGMDGIERNISGYVSSAPNAVYAAFF